MTTGEGLDTNEQFDKFMTFVHERYCKWYTELDSVLASRHNVWPAYTNEDVDYNSSQGTTEMEMNEHNSQDYCNDDSRSKRSKSYLGFLPNVVVLM